MNRELDRDTNCKTITKLYSKKKKEIVRKKKRKAQAEKQWAPA
jgi:hypothetical protein